MKHLIARGLSSASWLRPADHAALGDTITASSAVVLGQLLRLGALSESERKALRGVSVVPMLLEATARVHLEAFDDAEAQRLTLLDQVEARDAAESILWVLGELGATEEEARVRARAEEVDAAMLAGRDAWSATAVIPRDAWLTRIAELDASVWWLDLVALGALRSRVKGLDLGKVFGPATTSPVSPLRLRRSATARPADLRLYADVVGMESDPARAAGERGVVIARLFDGDVEVLAIGLRDDQEDLPAGLCVRRAGGGVVDLALVTLDGVTGGKSPAGWWTPLTPEIKGPVELTVRLGDRSEVLALDVSAR